MWGSEEPVSDNPLDAVRGPEAIFATLEDMQVVQLPSTGAILFASSRAHVNDLEESILTAAVAAQLGLRDLNRVRKSIVPSVENRPEPGRDRVLYTEAYFLAVSHMAEAGRHFLPGTDSPATLGVYAASIALHRLRASLFSIHLLYQLGLVYEGDTVARQMLEQIAWSHEAAAATTNEDLESIQSQRAISGLKRLIPYVGRLNGLLSKSAHAGIHQHRQHTSVHERGRLVHTRGLSGYRTHCASTILLLADAAVAVLESTQREHMTAFKAIDPENGYAYLPGSDFRVRSQQLLDELFALEHQPDEA